MRCCSGLLELAFALRTGLAYGFVNFDDPLVPFACATLPPAGTEDMPADVVGPRSGTVPGAWCCAGIRNSKSTGNALAHRGKHWDCFFRPRVFYRNNPRTKGDGKSLCFQPRNSSSSHREGSGSTALTFDGR
jgi:hypothetical protein